MEVRKTGRYCRSKLSRIFLSAFLAAASAAAIVGQESPSPVLITEANSTRALAVNADDWRGGLPSSSTAVIGRDSRVVVFVTSLDLLTGEGANAFRITAADNHGKRYRLAVENIQRIPKRPWIYGLTLRIHDPSGYNGQPRVKGGLQIKVSWRGNTSNGVRLTSGRVPIPDPDGLTPSPAPTSPIAFHYSTGGDRHRFMEQAAFGPTAALDFRLRQIGLRRWIDEQINKPYPTIPYSNFAQKPFDGNVGCGGPYGTSPEVDLCHRNHYWIYDNQNWMVLEALYGEDQLRRRVSWALHQIWVVSARTVYQNRWMQEYTEILDRNAFGNYRDLMREMTLSPAMGEYLDMVRSTRYEPNENYPRELLQLFSVGLYMLNPDGTYQLDGQGNRIPTYDQAKIDQFTKVFTGWSQCSNASNPACANITLGAPNFIDPMIVLVPDDHDLTSKTLFDYSGAPNPVIAACSNCTNDANRRAYADDSLNRTLDNIFHHPNVGPFVAKLLIQHLVTSDPSPAYVGRVAAAFNNNGSGVRGDMRAVVKAVLLDLEARGSKKTDPAYGKLREPLQYFTNIMRTFNVRAGTHSSSGPTTPPASCQGRSDGVFSWMMGSMGQEIWAPPTVFNYFPPDYVVPGTDILGPEFALANTGSSFDKNNFTLYLTLGQGLWFEPATGSDPYPYTPCGTSLDVSELTALAASDPSGNALIEALNSKMMHGTMSEAMKTKLRAAINFNIEAEYKARQALFLTASSSQYQIQR
ncbi:MAG: DUF1800 family protein [Pyrinomonadaceae bacterium]